MHTRALLRHEEYPDSLTTLHSIPSVPTFPLLILIMILIMTLPISGTVRIDQYFDAFTRKQSPGYVLLFSLMLRSSTRPPKSPLPLSPTPFTNKGPRTLGSSIWLP